MSTISDYKLYKQYEPDYKEWRYRRSLLDAKRLEYLKKNAGAVNQDDIKRGKALVRAIDIMDEYSQKYAQNMEMANAAVIGTVMELATVGGALLGMVGLSKIPAIQKFLNKFIKAGKNANIVNYIFTMSIGGALGTIIALPLYSKTAKAEIEASRKGRFEAMQKDLINPNGFAVLSDEQIEQAKKLSKNIQLEEDQNDFSKFTNKMKAAKKVLWNSEEYKKQKAEFELMLKNKAENANKPISAQDAENAKKDQQLLTKLVDKIDIASQDYAENAELSAGILTSVILAGGVLIDFIVGKLTKLFKIKSANKIQAISRILSVITLVASSIIGSSIAKEASRVGRYKAKQELLNNPSNFVYVDDDKNKAADNIKVKVEEKSGWFKFLRNAYKDKKEYDNYKKTQAKNDKKFYKAIEKLELTPEQIKEAKTLQQNTFMTFNKIDQKSQKFSENIEALGLTAEQPISVICSLLGVAFGMPALMKNAETKLERAANFSKYIGIVFLSILPVMFLNYFVTKEQKKASRVADMMAINEMQDYRLFRA